MRVLLVSEGEHEHGALTILVQRVLPHIEELDWDRVSRNDIHTHRGKGQGFLKRAVRWILEAERRKYDVLVLVIDEDGQRERVLEIDQAQAHSITALPRALGIAIRSFDAWMLADESALGRALGVAVSRLPAPEEDNHPKETCAGLLLQSNCGLWQRELYVEVVKTIDLIRLQERCPKGFSVFASRLRAL